MGRAGAIERLGRVMRQRRRQYATRIVVAAVIAGVFFGFTGWIFASLWFCAYVGLQLLELRVYPDAVTEVLKAPRAFEGTLALLAANTILLGSFGLAEAARGGSWGLACACLLWAGSIMNSVVVSIGSRAAFLAQAVPAAVFYLIAPLTTLGVGAPWIEAGAVTLAGGLNLLTGAAVWSAAQKLFEAESVAREELERRRQEAEAATEAKSAFVAMVSHELRTPISAILAGAAELECAAPNLALRSYGQLVADSARMMRRLLDDLLDLSKIEAGHMTAEALPFDFRAVILDTVRFWGPAIRRTGVRLRLFGATHAPRWVLGDPTRIKQILNNLLSNAAKFTQSGSITLRFDRDPADAEILRISVADTGPGLTTDQIRRLFQPFEQLSAATARTHGGTGLGLAISRRLARLMGGDLLADGRPGSGACFTLILRLAPARAAAFDPEASPRAAGPPPRAQSLPAVAAMRDEALPLRVLIVDDHEVNRRAFSLILEAIAAQTQTAADGAAALEALDAASFDLVLMDVNMPGIDGLEATRRLRASGGPNAGVPVIALTGHEVQQGWPACKEAGMDAIVTKPVEAGELILAVRRALAEAPRTLAAVG